LFELPLNFQMKARESQVDSFCSEDKKRNKYVN